MTPAADRACQDCKDARACQMLAAKAADPADRLRLLAEAREHLRRAIRGAQTPTVRRLYACWFRDAHTAYIWEEDRVRPAR